MITGISNSIPSFKRAYIKDDSKKNIDDIFNSKLKRKAFQFEMYKLYQISGDTDIFLSAQLTNEKDNGEREYELRITDKNDKILVMGMMATNRESLISLKSTLGILNCILKPRFEKKY